MALPHRAGASGRNAKILAVRASVIKHSDEMQRHSPDALVE